MKKRNRAITSNQLKRMITETTDYSYNETSEIIDKFWELLVKEMFETGKEVNIYRYGNFYIAKGRERKGGSSAKEEKIKKKSYFLRFDTSRYLRKKLMEKYGTEDYNVRSAHSAINKKDID